MATVEERLEDHQDTILMLYEAWATAAEILSEVVNVIDDDDLREITAGKLLTLTLIIDQVGEATDPPPPAP